MWIWVDPSDSDFDGVTVYLDGVFKNNFSKGTQFYNATGLASDTSYTISTRTFDINGNINSTWVNRTVKTAPPAGIKGDFNNNGRVDIGDVAKVAYMVVDKVTDDMGADFNGDGKVDIGDAAKIAYYLVGKVGEL